MLGFGALGEFPLADFGTPPPPVSVALPSVAIIASTTVPTLRAGKSLNAPPVTVTFASLVPAVQSGKHFDIPIVALTFSAPIGGVLAGRSIGLPSVLFGYISSDTDVQTGRILNLANTFTVVTDGLGSLGEGALGEFALGDGNSVSATYTRPIRLKLLAPPAAAKTGKNFGHPPIAISFAIPAPEADARLRHIRINAIAS